MSKSNYRSNPQYAAFVAYMDAPFSELAPNDGGRNDPRRMCLLDMGVPEELIFFLWLAGYGNGEASSAARIAELESEREFFKKLANLYQHMVITCGVAASHSDANLSRAGKYAVAWNSEQANQVRALRYDRDSLRSRVTELESQIAALTTPVELVGVLEIIESGHGFWSSCSGCHDTEDGYPTAHYPYSATFRCSLGSGCSECGGIGAVWDDTDYDDKANFLGSIATLTDSSEMVRMWQPIETAPKDGTTVLLIATRYSMLNANPEQIVGAYRRGWWGGTSNLSHVTHWMPLPDQPKDAREA